MEKRKEMPASNQSKNSTEVLEISPADTAWMLMSTCLVFIMIPGLGYFYSGITRKKNQLTMLLTTGLALGVVSLQWFLCGYSLSFSPTGSKFIGNFDNALLINVDNQPHPIAPTVPENVFMIFQCMFATITPALAFGSAAERTRISSYIIFLLVWSTLVYDFITYWTWGTNGWLHDFGVLDFAGGTPVHVTSGFSALAYALCVGPRRTVDFTKIYPSNISDVFLGTSLLWFGWFGFNGGSEFGINSRAVNAVIVSNLAAGVGGLTWMFGEMIKHRTKRMSLNGFCSGAIAGLVTITPASGFVRPHFAIVFGFLAGVICLLAVDIKKITRFKYDDACDVFAVHGTGGFLGCVLTGIFADNAVATMSGDVPINGGWINGNFIQVCYQLLSAVVAAVWSFVITFIILQIIGFIPFIGLKLTEHEEHIGSDWIELGEQTYGHDVQTYDRDYLKEVNRITKRESSLTILKSYFSLKSPIKNNIDHKSLSLDALNVNKNNLAHTSESANGFKTVSNGFLSNNQIDTNNARVMFRTESLPVSSEAILIEKL